jgi:DNA-binding NtrC family response regulator
VEHTGKRILIVDDEEGIRDLLKDNLEARGYVCSTAPNGDAALEILAAEPADLALIDIMMPRMTGLSLFQHLTELHPDTAVVFITAIDDVSVAVEHLKKGAYDYVCKPVSRARLG